MYLDVKGEISRLTISSVRMYSLSQLIMAWWWPKLGMETSRPLINIIIKVCWFWLDILFRFVMMDTPTGMFHIKFLFISYNRLISVSSEPFPLGIRVHVNYLSIILYNLVQGSQGIARTALWSPLVWASDRVITNIVHHKHTSPDLGTKSSLSCYGSYLIENIEGRTEGRDVHNAKWQRN